MCELRCGLLPVWFRYLNPSLNTFLHNIKANNCYTEQIVSPVSPLCYVVYEYICIYLVEECIPPHTHTHTQRGLKCWCENIETFTAHRLLFNKRWCEQATPRNVCVHPSVLHTEHLACFVNFTAFNQLSIKKFPHICRAADSGFGPR
jgi:hypothetical protein